MGVKYIFRLDDISWDMNTENFYKIYKIFKSYKIRPIIGVIPHNEDVKLKASVKEEKLTQNEFWKLIRHLQDSEGWDIALHGYNHVYTTDDSGIFHVNNRAEFAGIPLEDQEIKIKNGKKIFDEQDINIAAFMAPAHSLDWNTIAALKNNSINVITDGFNLYPYTRKGIIFVPQLFARQSKQLFGVFTFCLHINDWKEKQFIQLEKFLKNNCNRCTTFKEVVTLYKGSQILKMLYTLFNVLFFLPLKAMKFTKCILYNNAFLHGLWKSIKEIKERN